MDALTLTPKCICTCCFTVLHTFLDKILTEVLNKHSIRSVHVASKAIMIIQSLDLDRIRNNVRVLSHASVCKIEKL